ncbi:MAG: hypothetical protein Q9160_004809 [Pyrenula sp. 1 TL-2023]
MAIMAATRLLWCDLFPLERTFLEVLRVPHPRLEVFTLDFVPIPDKQCPPHRSHSPSYDALHNLTPDLWLNWASSTDCLPPTGICLNGYSPHENHKSLRPNHGLLNQTQPYVPSHLLETHNFPGDCKGLGQSAYDSESDLTEHSTTLGWSPQPGSIDWPGLFTNEELGYGFDCTDLNSIRHNDSEATGDYAPVVRLEQVSPTLNVSQPCSSAQHDQLSRDASVRIRQPAIASTSTKTDNAPPTSPSNASKLKAQPQKATRKRRVSKLNAASTNPSTPASSTSASSTSQTKDFYFVNNSDKISAAGIRNTLTSRKYRQSKVDRIRELEKELASRTFEMEMWKSRALRMGWNERRNDSP